MFADVLEELRACCVRFVSEVIEIPLRLGVFGDLHELITGSTRTQRVMLHSRSRQSYTSIAVAFFATRMAHGLEEACAESEKEWLAFGSTTTDGQSRCNMHTIDARTVGGEHTALAVQLLNFEEPVIITHLTDTWPAMASWSTRAGFLAEHGATQVQVATGQTVGQFGPEAAAAIAWGAGDGDLSIQLAPRNVKHYGLYRQLTLSLAEYASAMRNGSLSSFAAYIFSEVKTGTKPLEIPELAEFFQELQAQRLSTKLRQAFGSPEVRSALRGRSRLAFGGNTSATSGNSFHKHGDALNALITGKKRWFVARGQQPVKFTGKGTVDWLKKMELKKHRKQLKHGFWECVQQAGEVVHIPEGLEHAVINYGETLAVASQLDGPRADLIHVAAHNQHGKGLRALLAGGLSIDMLNARGRTALHDAAAAGVPSVVELLIENGANVNLGDGTDEERTGGGMMGRTALHYTVKPIQRDQHEGHAKIAQMLIRAGAHVDARDSQGRTALMDAAEGGHAEVLQVLLDGDAALGVFCDRGFAPMHYAALRGNERELALLLGHGASADLPSTAPHAATPLMLAAASGYRAACVLLLEIGAHVDARGSRGGTALMNAAANGHLEVVQLLLERGGDPLVIDSQGYTAESLATANRHEGVLRMLSSKS